MTGKSQDLYQAVIDNIFSCIPHFQQLVSMTDWQPAARNAMKKHFLSWKFMDVGSISHREFGPKHKRSDSLKISEIVKKLKVT